jgi:hypothetical protein
MRLGRLPEASIAPPPVRELRELVRHRAKLVAMRSNCKAQIHAVLAKCGVAVPMSDLFGVGGTGLLDGLDLAKPYAARIASLRRLIDLLEFEIGVFAKLVHGQLARDPGYTAVQTVPGIGPVLGAVLVAEIGDVHRFRTAEQLGCWAGMTPKHHESDTKVHRGRITKQRSRLVRWAIVESVAQQPADVRAAGHLADHAASPSGGTVGEPFGDLGQAVQGDDRAPLGVPGADGPQPGDVLLAGELFEVVADPVHRGDGVHHLGQREPGRRPQLPWGRFVTGGGQRCLGGEPGQGDGPAGHPGGGLRDGGVLGGRQAQHEPAVGPGGAATTSTRTRHRLHPRSRPGPDRARSGPAAAPPPGRRRSRGGSVELPLRLARSRCDVTESAGSNWSGSALRARPGSALSSMRAARRRATRRRPVGRHGPDPGGPG